MVCKINVEIFSCRWNLSWSAKAKRDVLTTEMYDVSCWVYFNVFFFFFFIESADKSNTHSFKYWNDIIFTLRKFNDTVQMDRVRSWWKTSTILGYSLGNRYFGISNRARKKKKRYEKNERRKKPCSIFAICFCAIFICLHTLKCSVVIGSLRAYYWVYSIQKTHLEYGIKFLTVFGRT